LITIIIHRACVVAAPVFAAKAIANLAVGDYHGAVLYLTIGILIWTFRQIDMHINYLTYSRIIRDPYLRIQNNIAKKVCTANKNFMSKSNILNILHNDTLVVADSVDLLTMKFGNLVQAIMVITTIFFLDKYIAAFMIGVCILNYFILNFINDKLAKGDRKRREAVDEEYEAFSNLYDVKDSIIFDTPKKELRNEFRQTGKKFINAQKYKTFWNSMAENTFAAFYYAIVFATTLFLVYMVRGGEMTLEKYLIVVPYLLLVIESCNGFFQLFRDIKNAHVCINRIEKVMEFSDKPMQIFGDNDGVFGNGGIDFIDVSAPATDTTPAINNINFHLNAHETTLIHGDKDSGKRAIFYCLTREIKPSGKILIGNVDAFSYSKSAYEKQLNMVAQKPLFVNGSIMRNLKIFERDEARIFEICTDLNIHETIMALPHQYNTDIASCPLSVKHMLEFARCILAKCEILLFYEMPNTLGKAEYENLKNQIKKYATRKTIIIFSRSTEWSDICNRVIHIAAGTVKEIDL